MVTGNFVTMENFPLYVSNEAQNEADDFEQIELCDMIQEELDDFNTDLLFFKVSLKSGYYVGVQFYVEDKYDFGKYMDSWDNYDCRYHFDMCRSVTIRKYASEINKVNKFLRNIAKKYEFQKLEVLARFSNGEVIYGRA